MSSENKTDKAAIDPKKINVAVTQESTSDSHDKSVNHLSADEQMALYEEDLKENDWGHRPC